MTRFLISPAERPPITTLGQVSSLCEKVGSDICWEGLTGLAGVQRKTTEDMVASVRIQPGQESRLAKEVQQMTSSLKYAFLVLEGTPSWDREGNLMSQHTKWTVKNHNGVLLSVQSAGIMVLTSRNTLETCTVVEHLYEWTQKKDHISSLLARPKPPSDGWGRMDSRTTFVHVFSALPSVSVELSARIFDKLGNVLKLKVTKEELLTVEGIGPKRADSIVKALS